MIDRRARNRWLADSILPHEAWIRRVLSRQARAAGLEVDDLVQEMYTILARMPSVEAISDPRSYALQIARSLVLQHVRRAKIVRIGSLSEQEDLDCAADHPTPEQQAVGRDELQRVAEAIDAMPEAVKRAFWLRRVEGLPQREVAKALGLSINTVEKQISRGIKILVEQFARGGSTPPHASSGDEAKHEGPVVNVRARVSGED